MTNFKTLSVLFAAVAIIFVASTGFLVASSRGLSSGGQTTMQTVFETTTVAGSSSNNGGQTLYTVNIGYKSSTGFYLVNGTGFSLYLFTNDTRGSGVSTCYGGCAIFWPAAHISSFILA